MVDEAQQEHANRLAEHLNHPHVQLTQLAKDLQTAPALDVASRIGQLNSAMQRLITIIKAHTPEPPPHPGEPNGQRIDASE